MDLFILLVLIFAVGASQIKIVSLLRKGRYRNIMLIELESEEILGQIINTTCADRAVTCRVHNGGQYIRLGESKKITVIMEPPESMPPKVKDVYSSFEIDNDYKRHLINLLDQEVIILDSINLGAGILQRKADADRITQMAFFYLGATATGFYFTFVATTSEERGEMLKPEHYSRIETQVHRQKRLFQRSIKKRIL